MLDEFHEAADKDELKEDRKRRMTYQNGQKRIIPRFLENIRHLVVQWDTKINDPDYKEKKRDIWYTLHYFNECYKRKDRLAAWSDEAKWISDLQRG
eukprot:scaffold81745_cov53-Cyclotella_meneghiniana.AAC.2